ncbi:MAG: replication initiator protein A [Bacteroidota bacterium]
MELAKEKKELMRIDVNIEKMPVVFFGSEKKKRALEKKIFESGEPYEISSVTSEDGSIVKKLSIAPNAAYGLLTEFDQDISVVVFSQAYELNKKLGFCPRKMRIAFSDFPKIMEISKKGRLYKDIEESAERTSNFEILQDKYVTVKEKGGTLKIYDKRSLKLFHFSGIHKEEKQTRSGKKIKKYYLEVEIPEWIANNIENFYTTEFDVKKYFMLKGGRAKRLYRILEFIRYEKTKFISYKKLKPELWIDAKEEFHVKEALKRCLTPLVKSSYLTNFKFDKDGVVVTFSSVKKRRPQMQLTFEEIARRESLVSMILEKLGDTKSKSFYYKVAQKYPEDLIHKCLSLTQEVIETKGIKKSKGAIFTDILKREGEKLGIVLS